ncbi:MAG: YkgJ family cysteine cluster protein [Spirochaetes bacterium]|nr:YkgJ family cysteine cluster protein [Spirochaetota bacterium]MBU1082065.1 YkgJ family cysteine cluster protein [Spirochaetota bacterium]
MDIASILPPSLLSERLESLGYLYRRADAAVSNFVEASGVSCPFGCGSCCEAFVPDILPLEAAYLAAFLVAADRPRAYSMAAAGLEARRRDDGRVGCPLYADGTPYHCTVYEARPLICRMFAFSATRDKLGVPAFSVCRSGSSAKGPRSASGPGLAAAYGAEPPVMADMGSELAAIDPESAGSRGPLPEALLEALGRVLFLVGMKEDDPLDSGPDIRPPLPRAG